VIAAVVLRSAGALTSGVETDPHVNVYLTLEATDADVKRIEAALRSNPQTASVRFVSRKDALDELKSSTHLAEILASLDRNPLPHAFTCACAPTTPRSSRPRARHGRSCPRWTRWSRTSNGRSACAAGYGSAIA
jgi:cell division protein FtsX